MQRRHLPQFTAPECLKPRSQKLASFPYPEIQFMIDMHCHHEIARSRLTDEG
jgi:hypothetical protein